MFKTLPLFQKKNALTYQRSKSPSKFATHKCQMLPTLPLFQRMLQLTKNILQIKVATKISYKEYNNYKKTTPSNMNPRFKERPSLPRINSK